MKHIHTTIAQAHLATVLLAAISLGTYGCADTASVNPVVELASLTITPGTLQPTFKSSTTQYSVDLTSDISTVTITAQPAVSGDRVTINGLATTSRTIPLGLEGSTTSVSIVVSESDSNSRTYTVLITRSGPGGNNSLQNLTVSPGSLAPAFNANELIYSVNVGNTVSNVEVIPTLQDPTATMTINGQNAVSGSSSTIALNPPGQSTPITIIVTAQNGNQKPYLVTVNRGISGNNFLQSLTITPGTLNPAFNAGTDGYSVNVASNVASVVVTPTVADTTATMRMRVNVGPLTDIASGVAQTITLPGPNSHTFVTIEVTAEDGSRKNYVILVDKVALGDNNLSALTVSPGSLIPSFAPNTTDYTVNVASDVASVAVSATKAVPNAVMTGDVTAGAGNSTGNATISLNGPGTPTNITINVTAPNGGTPKTYSITVNRAASSDNNLSALTVSPGTLDPVFAPGTLPYTVHVATDVTEVTVTATKADPNAVLSGSVLDPGAGQATGQATIPLGGPGSDTPVSITVTAPNGEFKTYTITVNRAAPASDNNLSALTVEPGPLVPDFAPGTTAYFVDVPSSVGSVTVSATKSDPAAVMSGSVTAGSGQATGQATIDLPIPLLPTPVTITVTAPNGDSKTYSIIITRALL
ncbi:MAG: cadherin-like beta sandwich domain-containing protein [Nitrospira sp.]|nr:cadherin-like beta sandwich domain-containing protein [Nitrospira sp.]